MTTRARPGSFGARPCTALRQRLLTRGVQSLPFSFRKAPWIVRRILATPTWADFRAIRCIYDRAAYLTDYTGIPHVVDHVEPLGGHYVSGLHCEFNLEAVPEKRNQAKSNHRVPASQLRLIP